MKKLSLVLGIFFVLLLVGVVSADLCKGSDGYYHDCSGSSSGFSGSDKVIISGQKSNWEDDSDRYRQCLADCDRKYKSYCYSKSERCTLREDCYDSCTEKSSYFEKVEYVEKIEDKRDFYKESYEYKTEIKDETIDLWNENNYEVIYSDKREYEYEKPYFTRDSAVVYVNPYREKVVYLDSEQDYNKADYGCEYKDYSSWRYKEDYYIGDYQYCECDKWRNGECVDYECYYYNWDDYYYKPRQSFNGGFEWGW